jgi:hypothetical protein
MREQLSDRDGKPGFGRKFRLSNAQDGNKFPTAVPSTRSKETNGSFLK